MKIIRYPLAGLLLLAAACDSGPRDTSSDVKQPIAQSQQDTGAGGSNYIAYRMDGCLREPYGVVNSYDVASSTIQSQLRQMVAAGQRRLRIPILHHRASDSGTSMDSTGGNLSAKNRANLANLLAAVKDAGFAEVEVGFFPLEANSPMDWDALNEDYYQENWNLISNLHPIIAQAGIPYRIDLSNEAMPMSGDKQGRFQYATRLWNDYTWNFGKADTIGFSMTVWLAGRVAQIPTVYGNNPPDVLEFHLYRDPSGWNKDEYVQFVDAKNKMNDLGLNQPIIVGETYFNDATSAANIRRAINDTGANVLHLLQWPMTYQNNCPDTGVDTTPPTAFDAFAAQGF